MVQSSPCKRGRDPVTSIMDGGVGMETQWYALLDSKREEGPLSLDELKGDRRLTPETLLRREGSENWILASDVPELEAFFRGSSQHATEGVSPSPKGGEEMVLVLENGEPPTPLLWLALSLFVLVYVLFRLYGF